MCVSCGQPVSADELALSRKLINRGLKDGYCLACLSGHFQVSEKILRDKIAFFREMGCTLFSPAEDSRGSS